jgi:sugar O-acyltransferase (sialic acid O-acetyltransferase NeuD family)
MSRNKTLALIGGGGFACEVLEIARLCGYTVSDYYAPQEGSIDLAYRGYLDELVQHRANYDGVAVAFGAVNQADLRRRHEVVEFLDQNGLAVPAVVSPHAVVSAGVELGRGVFVAHAVVISVHASIGDYCLLNTGAIIGHHTQVGKNTMVSPKVFIGGNCQIAGDVVLGAGANVLQGCAVGQGAMVGVGVDVFQNVKPNSTVWPARYQVTGPKD